MYEIWLAVNIIWEIALGIWPWLVGATLVWVALMAGALRRPGARWRAGLPLALIVGAVVAIGTLLLVPSAINSSLGEMGYWVDWANLGAIALGFGAVAAAFAWPLSAMRSSRAA